MHIIIFEYVVTILVNASGSQSYLRDYCETSIVRNDVSTDLPTDNINLMAKLIEWLNWKR